MRPMTSSTATARPRIVFLAVDDEYAGAMQQPLYARHPEWIVGSVLSSSRVYRKSDLQALAFLLRHSGVFYVLSMAKAKLLHRPRSKRGVLPSLLANTHNVPTLLTNDINSPGSVAWLRRLRPDLAVSTNFSHILKNPAMDTPRRGTWNLHKSKLPEYRGMAPAFYALLGGASEVGVTLHVMDEGVDTGPTIAQLSTPVDAADSVHSLNSRLSNVGGEMLADLLDQHPDLNMPYTPQPPGDWTSHSYPSRQDVRLFRRKGLRFT